MSLRKWRTVHRWIAGYRRSLGTVLLLLFAAIAITGFLLNHINDFSFISHTQVPLWLLPGGYTDRVEVLNVAQSDLPVEQLKGAPLRWIIWDLHTGDFFGPWGVFLYDALAIFSLILVVTGFYMLIVIRSKRLEKKRRE